jgi:hypothetical protein
MEISFVPLSQGFDLGYRIAVFLTWCYGILSIGPIVAVDNRWPSASRNKFCKCLNKGINGQWWDQFQVNHMVYHARQPTSCDHLAERVDPPYPSNTAASHTRGTGEVVVLAVICFASCLLHTLQVVRMAQLLCRPLRIQNFSRKRPKSPCTPTWHDFTCVLNTSICTSGWLDGTAAGIPKSPTSVLSMTLVFKQIIPSKSKKGLSWHFVLKSGERFFLHSLLFISLLG